LLIPEHQTRALYLGISLGERAIHLSEHHGVATTDIVLARPHDLHGISTGRNAQPEEQRASSDQ
jgi:hypothetical protein